MRGEFFCIVSIKNFVKFGDLKYGKLQFVQFSSNRRTKQSPAIRTTVTFFNRTWRFLKLGCAKGTFGSILAIRMRCDFVVLLVVLLVVPFVVLLVVLLVVL